MFWHNLRNGLKEIVQGTGIDRRTFIKSMAIGAGASYLAGSQTVYAQQSNDDLDAKIAKHPYFQVTSKTINKPFATGAEFYFEKSADGKSYEGKIKNFTGSSKYILNQVVFTITPTGKLDEHGAQIAKMEFLDIAYLAGATTEAPAYSERMKIIFDGDKVIIKGDYWARGNTPGQGSITIESNLSKGQEKTPTIFKWGK